MTITENVGITDSADYTDDTDLKSIKSVKSNNPCKSVIQTGYKQTEVGMIPEDWEVNPLCKVAEIRSGIAKNSNVSVSDPVFVHYLRVANVQDGFLDLKEVSKINVARSDLNRYAVLPGDVLMNEGGGGCQGSCRLC